MYRFIVLSSNLSFARASTPCHVCTSQKCVISPVLIFHFFSFLFFFFKKRGSYACHVPFRSHARIYEESFSLKGWVKVRGRVVRQLLKRATSLTAILLSSRFLPSLSSLSLAPKRRDFLYRPTFASFASQI